MIGSTVGSYRILRQVGEGGMGAVYLGEHTMLGRPAAIKILLPSLSHNREIVGRFFNEARATTAIRHPGIVEIYDFGFLPDGAAYIAMEMLDGESLASRLRRVNRLPIGAAIEIGRQTAAALHAAHSRGITHRDLKPDNMFLIRDPEIGERVKLLDFGIAKLVTDEGGNRTRTGVVMGTPVYMSPEQCRGTATLDHRADLYSLGCVLYELVAGRPPFVAESAGDIIAHHLYFQPESVRVHDGSIPAPLEQLIMALLAKEPGMRPSSAAEVNTILDGWRNLAATGPSSPMRSAPMMPRAVTTVPPTVPPAGPIASANPTTLSGSAGAVMSVTGAGGTIAPARRRGGLMAIGAAVVAVAAVAIVLVTRQPGTPATVASTAPAAAPPAVSAPGPSAPAPAAATPPAPAAVTPPPPAVTPPPPAAIAAAAPATPPESRPAAVEPSAQAAAAAPSATRRSEEPAPHKAAHVTAAAKPAATPKAHDAVPVAPAPAPREEPKAVAAPAPPPPPPVEIKAPPAEVSQKAEPKPAVATAPAKPAASKWGHLMGDKGADANTGARLLFQKCKLAATSGDCVSARSLAANIAEQDIAMYRARVLTDPDIAACLSHK